MSIMSAPSLQMIVSDIADSLVMIDSSGIPHGTRGRTYLPGVGPYGEPRALVIEEKSRQKEALIS